MLHPVSEVADMEARWDRLFDKLTQFSSTVDDTMLVSFESWLELDPSGLLKRLFNTLVCCSMPKRLELSGSIVMRVQATDIFEDVPPAFCS